MIFPDNTLRSRPPGSCFFTLVLLLLVLVTTGAAAVEPATDFEPDETLGGNARKWAEEFVVFAEERYDVKLDWSQVSIKYLDDIVNELHTTFVSEQPDPELVSPIARALGSYVAEVYRIFYGGQWGWINLDSGSYPGVRSEAGSLFLPLKKAHDRIVIGDGPDIWEYFQLLTEQ